MSESRPAGEEFPRATFGLPKGAFRLDGKVAVVTGSSKNIGTAIALAFAEAGGDVVMVARKKERLEAAANMVRAAAPDQRILTFVADVGRAEDADGLCAFVQEEAGGADVLVNNAAGYGTTKATTILEIGDETWDEVHRTNVLGPFRLIRGMFAEAHKSGRPGNIINVLSGSGFLPVPTPLAAPYAVSKAALWMMTRYLSQSLAPHIRVNALVPGVVTPSGQPRNNVQAALMDQIPMGRLGMPGEVAGAALYLASEASSYTSGEVIFCNGARAW